MTTKSIKFTGPEDFRILGKADIAKAGVDAEGFKRTTFANGKPTDVDETAAAAILAEPDLFGQFEEVQDAEEEADRLSKIEQAEAADAADTSAEATNLEVGEGTGRAGIKHSTKSSSRPR